MPYLFVLFGFAAFWLFKSGKLNFIVKGALQKAYKGLFENSQDFQDMIEVKQKRDDVEITTGSYVYKSEGAFFDAVKSMDFRLDFALNFYNEKKRLKQTIILEKSGAKHKFSIDGEFEIKGQVVIFKPDSGDLSILPEHLRNGEIKFIIQNEGENNLLISFNCEQIGSSALCFEYQ